MDTVFYINFARLIRHNLPYPHTLVHSEHEEKRLWHAANAIPPNASRLCIKHHYFPSILSERMTLSNFFKKIFSPFLMGNCLGMIVVSLALVFVTLEFLQCYTNHGDNVTMPNMRGLKLDIVEQKLEALGLRCEVVDTGYIDTYVGDVVLEQSVRPGDKIKVGRIIELTINASSARAIALPQLADNCSRREAEAKLKSLGFKSIIIERIQGDQDWVYNVKANGETVQAGTRIPVTTRITLVIGNGAVDEEFNGNDSLDYEIFGPGNEDNDIIEDGGGESLTPSQTPPAE